jgi:hypothetical protein
MLGHGVLSVVLPLGNVHEVGYHLDGNLHFLLMLHLGTDGLEVPGTQVIDTGETDWPGDVTSVVTHPCSSFDAVLME